MFFDSDEKLINFNEENSRKRHLHHIVETHYGSFLVGIFTFFFVSNIVFKMYHVESWGAHYLLSTWGFFWSISYWLDDIIFESTHSGDSTKIVEICVKHSICLLFVSEVMVFFGLFASHGYYHFFPSIWIGNTYPPYGIEIVKPWLIPLLNTLVLLLSGFSITWAHESFELKRIKSLIDATMCTIFLGLFFLLLQYIEFYSSTFDLSDSVYGSIFFFLTGLHAWHVIVGVICIIVCLERTFCRHFLYNNYLGFILVIWYWHLVDVIWLILWLTVYVSPFL